MKPISFFTTLAAASLPLIASAQTTIFNDDFTGASTVDQAPTSPTATSTSYEWFSGIAGGTASISPGDLRLSLPNTTSVLGEAQAQFTSSPVTLTTVGDYITLTLIFTDNANIMLSGNNNSSLAIGLFNSGGVAPNQGVINLSSTTSPVSGGSQNWRGESSVILESSGSNRLLARPAQGTSTTSQNQDLLFNNASGSQAYNNPTGTQIAAKSDTASPVSLTAGNLYTNFFSVTLSGVNSITVSNQLSGAAGILFNNIGTAALSILGATNSFDAFAFGWRESVSAAAASTMDVGLINVTAFVQPVPEPSTLALAGMGAAALAYYRRQRK